MEENREDKGLYGRTQKRQDGIVSEWKWTKKLKRRKREKRSECRGEWKGIEKIEGYTEHRSDKME